MSRRASRAIAWLVGIAAVIAIVGDFRPPNFLATLSAIGFSGVASWVALTLFARLLLAETTVEPLEALGYKLAAINASDIGAMGGEPLFALLSIALPQDLEFDFLRRFRGGLKKACRRRSTSRRPASSRPASHATVTRSTFPISDRESGRSNCRLMNDQWSNHQPAEG